MKIAILNRSDATGGAAVVSRRLMEALRNLGHDARMLVVEKRTGSPFVVEAAAPRRAAIPFLAERLGIFLANGLSRRRLFLADTASAGLPLWRHPLVREADAVILNWVNQGMLSLKGVRRIAESGKPLLWTMHDMWCATGICHHAGTCSRFTAECGRCPLLGVAACSRDISRRTWRAKQRTYGAARPHFVAVSNWLAGKCRESSLLGDAPLSVIPNAFPIGQLPPAPARREKRRIIFGAARLDDPIKGFPILIRATEILAADFPELMPCIELVTFGTIRDASLLDRIAVPHRHMGRLDSPAAVAELFATGTVALSTSLYETLPGTLVEGQAAGCLAVAFDSGGQSDIIDHGENGFLARLTPDDTEASARSIARAIADALAYASRSMMAADLSLAAGLHVEGGGLRESIHRSVIRKFSAEAVARRYVELIESIAK